MFFKKFQLVVLCGDIGCSGCAGWLLVGLTKWVSWGWQFAFVNFVPKGGALACAICRSVKMIVRRVVGLHHVSWF